MSGLMGSPTAARKMERRGIGMSRAACATSSFLGFAGALIGFLSAGQTLSAQTTPYIGVVTGNQVNIRTGGSRNHPAFAALLRGQRVIVASSKNEWCRIHIPRWIPVYVHKNYVEKNGSRGIVKAGQLNVRIAARRKSLDESVGIVSQGSLVEITGEEGEWLKIVPPPTVYAFISDRFITKERQISSGEVSQQLALLDSSPGILKTIPENGGKAATPVLAGTFSSPAIHEADVMFRKISSSEIANRDYSPIKAIYRDLIRESEDLMEVAAAKDGLKRIQAEEERDASLLRAKKTIAEVDEKNRKLDEQLRQTRIAGRGADNVKSDPYLARGWVTGMGRSSGQHGTHRLLKGSRVLYYLQSEDGTATSLDAYLHKRVGVNGVIRELDPKFGANLIIVKEIIVLSDY